MSATKATEKPPTISDVFSGPMVVIKVGVAKKPYRISKALVMHFSGYFRSAFGARKFEEGVTSEITLEDVYTSVFEFFLPWLHTHEFVQSGSIKWPNSRASSKPADHTLTELVIFADRFIIPKLERTVTEMAVKYFNSVPQGYPYPIPSYGTMVCAFAELPEDHIFLRILVDATFRNWSDAHYTRPSEHEREWFEQLPSKCLLFHLTNISSQVSRSRRHKSLVFDNYLGGDVGFSRIGLESDSWSDSSEF